MPTERTVLVRLKANVSDFNRGLAEAAAGVSAFRKEINTTNDRTAWLTQGILALAPAIAPLGAAAIPVLTGVATQMTVAGVAAGTLLLGFHGVGDALKALNDYQLEPTAEHLTKLKESMGKVGVEGEQFVVFLDSLGPQISQLQELARAGMFPGMEHGIESLMTKMPELRAIISETAKGIGQISAEAGDNLAGPKFEEFFHFLERDARPILVELAHTIGNVADGIVALLMDFMPVSKTFSAGLEASSKSFAEWAHGLDQTQGFQDFLAYINESGPKALDFIGALSTALLEVVKAAAPVGDQMLPLLTELLKVIAAIADTPIGTALIGLGAAISLYGRAMAITQNLGGSGGMVGNLKKTQGETLKTAAGFRTLSADVKTYGRNLLTAGANSEKMQEQNRQALSGIRQWGGAVGSIAGKVGLLALVLSGVDEKMGLTNTASLTFAGNMIGGKWGTAIGFATGATIDFTNEQHAAADATTRWSQALDQNGGSIEAYRAAVAQAKADTDAFARQAGASGGLMSHLLAGFTPAGIDTNVHALFGDMADSQLGQMSAAQESLVAQSRHHEQTAALMSQFLGNTAQGQTPTLDQMDESITRVQPALDKLHLTFDDLDRAMGMGNISVFQKVVDTLNHMDSAKQHTRDVAAAISNLGTAESTAAQKATALQQALDDLLSPGMNLTATTDAWFHGLHHLNEELDKHHRTLVGNTDAAETNRAAIAGLVTNMKARITAEVAGHQSSTKVTADFKAMRQGIIDNAVALGLNRKEVENLLDRWKLTPKIVSTAYKIQGINVAFRAAAGLRETFKSLPKDVKTEIRTHGIPESQSAIDDLQRRFKLTPKQVSILVALKNAAALAGIRATAIALSGLRDKTIRITTIHSTGGRSVAGYADGGFTGPGGKYEPRGVVHAGELVIPQDMVYRDWSMLKSRYGHLPGFADGGLVAATMPSMNRASAAGRGAPIRLTVDEIPVTGRVDVDTGAFRGMARIEAHQVYTDRSEADHHFEETHR